jgi:hypothetical protein
VTGRWTGWQELDLDSGVGPGDPDLVPGRTRGGTNGLWVGESNGVEVTVVSATGKVSSKLPTGLRLELVDPGVRPNRAAPAAPTGAGTGDVRGADRSGQGGGVGLPLAEPGDDETPDPTTTTDVPTPDPTDLPTAEPTAEPTVEPTTGAPTAEPTTGAPTAEPTTTPPSTGAPAPTATTTPLPPMPAYVNRAGWNADESIVHDAPVYGTTLKALFVHHTYHSGAASNDYDCANAGAIVRSIQVYAVTGKGLSDIEYNFLVDKCGTLYEGRKGGVDRLVVGAHTIGFNTNFMAVAALGDFQTVEVSDRVRSVIAQLAAYKLGLYGIDPLGTVTHTLTVKNSAHRVGDVVTLNRISGHRDADATICPGPALYGQLPAIRAEVVDLLNGPTPSSDPS